MADERILGDWDFVSEVLKESEEKMLKRDRLNREGWDLNKIKEKVCKELKVDKEDLKRKSKRSKISEARSLIAYLGSEELGISGVEIAKFLGITKSLASESIQRGSKIAKGNRYRIG